MASAPFHEILSRAEVVHNLVEMEVTDVLQNPLLAIIRPGFLRHHDHPTAGL
jgi:hypothetical protein